MGTFRSVINSTLKELLKKDSNVILLGQSIRDPFGGAFKVTRGLTRSFNDQIIDLPIAEAATIGMATGLALNGYRPVVEIMFSDFMTLSIDQIYNHINKLIDIYSLDIGIVIRMASGAGRAYGATHSQNIETFLLGIPNVVIYTPTLYSNIFEIYEKATYSKGVNIIVEGKLLYDQQLRDNTENFRDTRLDVICYGEHAHIICDIAKQLPINPIYLDCIKPFELPSSKVKNSTVLIIEPSFVDQSFVSWAQYNIHQTYTYIYSAGADTPTLPCGAMREKSVILTKEKIEQKIVEILGKER